MPDTMHKDDLAATLRDRAIAMGTAHFSKRERESLLNLLQYDSEIAKRGCVEFKIIGITENPTDSYRYPLHIKVQRVGEHGKPYGGVLLFIPHVRSLTGLQSTLERYMRKYRTYLRDAKLPCTSDAALIGTIITVTRATPHSDLFKYRLQWTLPAVHVQGWAGFKFHVRQVYAHWSAKLSDLVNKLR